MVAATILMIAIAFGFAYLFGTGRISMAWGMIAIVAAFAILFAVVFSAEGSLAQGGWLGLAIFVPIGAGVAYFSLLLGKMWVARWYPHWRVKR